MDIIPRKEALARGLPRYFTGKPCKHGHVAERYAGNRVCAACSSEQSRVWYVSNDNGRKVRERARAWREANPERVRSYYPASRERDRERSHAWRKSNAERQRENQHAWYVANRKKARENCSAWRKANPDKANALYAKRRASKLQRTPPWADLDAIQFMYEMTLPGEHVDHIIPLRGKFVSGLHVSYNLQHLPGHENCSKNNSFDPWTFEGP